MFAVKRFVDLFYFFVCEIRMGLANPLPFYKYEIHVKLRHIKFNIESSHLVGACFYLTLRVRCSIY